MVRLGPVLRTAPSGDADASTQGSRRAGQVVTLDAVSGGTRGCTQATRSVSSSEGLYGPIVYVGMAGERRGQGIRGRLNVYGRGKALVSSLGEAVMDRALAVCS